MLDISAIIPYLVDFLTNTCIAPLHDFDAMAQTAYLSLVSLLIYPLFIYIIYYSLYIDHSERALCKISKGGWKSL